MGKTFWTVGGAVGAVFLLVGAPGAAEPKARVFDMEKISLLAGDSDEAHPTTVSLSARYQPLGYVPHNEVKKYPELKSSRPLYGSVSFGQIPTDPNSGIRFFFAVDESEPAEKQKGGPSVLDTLAGAMGDRGGAAATHNYDRLYFDANRDLDLTNDPVIKPMADPSRLGSSYPGGVVFDVLSVPLNQADGLGAGPLEVLPRLRLQSSSRAYIAFSMTTARKGTVELGGKKYTALLTQPAVVTGRFDSPFTSLILIPADDSSSPFPGLIGQRYLSSMFWDHGSFFELSATPDGDRLTISPYRGDTGVLKVDSGNRQGLERLGVSGALRSGQTTLQFGETSYFGHADKLPQHNIPVGDYLPLSVSVDLGPLSVSLSQNYYSMEEPYTRLTDLPMGSISIRKDKPCVLGFSGKPVVQFTSPAKDQVFKPGDTVKFGARMVDSKLNLLIRGLYDTTQKASERSYRISGQTVAVPVYASLAPTVTITDPAGKMVVEGTMPFG